MIWLALGQAERVGLIFAKTLAWAPSVMSSIVRVQNRQMTLSGTLNRGS